MAAIWVRLDVFSQCLFGVSIGGDEITRIAAASAVARRGPVVLVVLDRRRAEATSQLQVDLVSKGFRAWVNDPFLLPLNATQESAKIILVPVTQEGSDIEAVNYQAGLPKTPLQWKLLWNLGVLVPLLVEIGVQGPYSPWRDLAALAWGAIGVSIYWCRLKKISQKPGGIPTS